LEVMVDTMVLEVDSEEAYWEEALEDMDIIQAEIIGVMAAKAIIHRVEKPITHQLFPALTIDQQNQFTGLREEESSDMVK